jgi:hypothetical protein
MKNVLETILYEIAARLFLALLGVLVIVVGLISPNRCLKGIRAAALDSMGDLILRTRK